MWIFFVLKKVPKNTSQHKYKCRLFVRAKRLHTPGETTLSLGETTLSEQDIGQNDRNSRIYKVVFVLLSHLMWVTLVTQISYILHCPAQSPHVSHTSYTDFLHAALSCTVDHLMWVTLVTQISYMLHCPAQSIASCESHSRLKWVTLVTQISYILHFPAQSPYVSHTRYTDLLYTALSCSVTLCESH